MDKEEENKDTKKPHVNQETVDAIAEGHRLANDPDAPVYHDIKKSLRGFGIVKNKVGSAA